MANIKRFEDLICWQKARHLEKLVYKTITNEACNNDFRFQSQIRAASVSAMTNIVEGFNRYHKKNFIRFLDISQSSAAEVFKTSLGLIKYLNSKLNNQSAQIKEPETEYIINDIDYWDLPDDFCNILAL